MGTKCCLFVLLLTAHLAINAAQDTPQPKAAEPTSEFQIPPTKSNIGSKKILVLVAMSYTSHHKVFNALTDELLERGHHVTFVSPLPQKKSHPRLRKILIKDLFAEANKNITTGFLEKRSSPFQVWFSLYGIGPILVKEFFKNTEVLALKKESFDLVVASTFIFQESLLGFAHHFGCPSLTINAFGYYTQINEFTGGAINPAYVPNPFGTGKRPDTFLDRLYNTLFTIFSMLTYHFYYYPTMNALMHEAFPDAPPLNDVLKNVSMTFINSHPAIAHPVPLSPSVVAVGGLHIKPGKPLPDDLKKWIEDSKDGIVYFSLGSNLQAHRLPDGKREALFNSFRKLKQRVLVKWNGEIPANAPRNCRFEQWIPQQEVLAHPKLKVFLTHGGLLSTQEAVYYGAAVVGMPVFTDQFGNMALAVQKGFAQTVLAHDLTTDSLDAALNEVIYNPKYREQSKKLSVRFRSDPVPPLEKAVYYTELLMNLGELKHLQPSSVYLEWYQYLLLDVMVVIAIGLYIVWRITFFIFRTLLRLCISSKVKKD